MAGSSPRPCVLLAPDSFKGTCTAQAVTRAMAAAAIETGWDTDECPMSDGGDGFASIVARHSGGASSPGGRWVSAVVSGPLGSSVEASWWWEDPEAVMEAAAASGLVLAGGPSRNDPMRASSRGTGELIAAARDAGATRVLVGLGGSASTDGGLGAVEALVESGDMEGVEVVVACDVHTPFLEAAVRFGPQKGASAAQVEQLTARLERLAALYLERFGVDVRGMAHAGAAGGLGGGLAAVGARLVAGFEVVAQRVGLPHRIRGSGLVVTGEGRLDASSWSGKVVGGVVSAARREGVPVLAVVGERSAEAASPDATVEIVSLSERFGKTKACEQPESCVFEVVRDALLERGVRRDG